MGNQLLFMYPQFVYLIPKDRIHCPQSLVQLASQNNYFRGGKKKQVQDKERLRSNLKVIHNRYFKGQRCDGFITIEGQGRVPGQLGARWQNVLLKKGYTHGHYHHRDTREVARRWFVPLQKAALQATDFDQIWECAAETVYGPGGVRRHKSRSLQDHYHHYSQAYGAFWYRLSSGDQATSTETAPESAALTTPPLKQPKPFACVPGSVFEGHTDQLFSARGLARRICEHGTTKRGFVDLRVALTRFARSHFQDVDDGFLDGVRVWRLGRWHRAALGMAANMPLFFLDPATQDLAQRIFLPFLKKWWTYHETHHSYLDDQGLNHLYQKALAEAEIGEINTHHNPDHPAAVILDHFKAHCLDSWCDHFAEVLLNQSSSTRWVG